MYVLQGKFIPWDYQHYFDQCLLCEVTCQNQKGYIAVTYHSQSQSSNEFEDFLFSLEKLINQIKQLMSSFTIILGDFNARFSNWLQDDITFLKVLILII